MLRDTHCCGVGEFNGLHNPRESLCDICDTFLRDRSTSHAHIMFTDVWNNGSGRRLANYIAKHGLGVVVRTRAKRNPNTGHSVVAWLYTPNVTRLRKWYNG